MFPSTTSAVPSQNTVRYGRRRLWTVLVAAGAGLAGWLVAAPIAGIDLAVQGTGDGTVSHVGPAAVLAAGLVAGLLGWAVLAGLERLTARARPLWTTIAGLVLVASLLGPLAAPTVAALVALVTMHLLVGGTLIVGLRRSTRRA